MSTNANLTVRLKLNLTHDLNGGPLTARRLLEVLEGRLADLADNGRLGSILDTVTLDAITDERGRSLLEADNLEPVND